MSRIKVLSFVVVFFALWGGGWPSATPAYAQAQLGSVSKSYNGPTSPVAGQALPYTVTIPNVGSVPLTNVVFTDFPDPLSPLMPGSVTTTQGTIVKGNGAGDTSVIVEVGTIAPGASVTITYDARVCTCIQYPVEITNQGFVNTPDGSTPTDNPNTSNPGDPTTISVTPKAMPQLGQIQKSCTLQNDADGGGKLSPDDTLRYTVDVPNNGSIPVVDAVFTDFVDPNTHLVPGSVTSSQGTVMTGNALGDNNIVVLIGTIDPGKTVHIAFDVTIDTNISQNQVTNQGFVDSQAGTIPTDDPGTSAPEDPTVCQVFPKELPQYQAIKSVVLSVDADGSGVASAGDTLSYTISIPNTGNIPLNGVTFNDALDPQTRLVSGSVTSSQGTVLTGNSPEHTSVVVNVGTVAPGTTATITFDATVNAGATGTIANQGTVTTSDGGSTPGGTTSTPTDNPGTSTPGDATTTPVGPQQAPELGIPTKVAGLTVDADGNGTASVGDTLTYTISIPNVGQGLIPDVGFSDVLDPGTTLVVGSVLTSQGTVVRGNAPGDTSVEVSVGTLPAGQTATITFEVTINATATGTIANQGTVSTPGGTTPGTVSTPTDNPGTSTPGDATSTPVTPQGVPLLPTKEVALQSDADGSGQPSVGDVLRYTITIPNVSVASVPGVLFSDFLDPNTTLLPGRVLSSKGRVLSGNALGDTSVRVDVGTLAPGEVVTIIFDATINPGTTGTISNQGIVEAPVMGKTPTDNPATPAPNEPTLTQVVPSPQALCEATVLGHPASAVTLVRFGGTAKSLGSNVVFREWDFGDGGTCSNSNPDGCSARFGSQVVEGTPRNPVHLFKGIGRFVVRLKLTDNLGNQGSDACVFAFGDPPLVAVLDANANDVIDDSEILLAIDYWITGNPVPHTDNRGIDDKLILTLIDLWIKQTSVSL